ncbi:hypothetical protein [Bradyrhizobium sp.]
MICSPWQPFIGIVAYACSTEIPVAMLDAKYKRARGAGLL